MRTKDEQDLLKACTYSQFDKIETLLKQGTSPQVTLIDYPANGREMDNYRTPIGEIMHHLYSEKHLDVVKKFLDLGVDVNSYTHHTVTGNRSTPLGRALIAHTHDSGMTCPEIQQKMIDFLLSRGADITLLSGDDLAKFIERGESALLESLLHAGLNPSIIANGQTLLEHVISAWTGSWGDNQTAKAILLINSGADLSVRNARGKSLAQRVQRPDILNVLIEKDSNSLATMTLHDRVILESPKYTQQLIDRGDDINLLDDDGHTPLMQAASVGQAKSALLLMNAGANMNYHNVHGETAMHLAMASAQSFGGSDYGRDRRFPILLELYSRGAIPQLDKQGRTPLMRCHVASKDYSTIRFCIHEFSKFEAEYYSFDPGEYESEMLNVYRQEMGKYKAFTHLPIQDNPKHFFIGKLIRKLQSIPPLSREELVEKSTKELLIALNSNNETKANDIMMRFPEINLNQLMNADGLRPLSIVIRSVTYSKDDCLPMLKLLIANHIDVNLADNTTVKDTPLLACNDDHHYIDIRTMRFLLAHGANPNLANAAHETPLHKSAGTFCGRGHNVEEAITRLLQYGADPDALTGAGKKPIDMIPCPWNKTAVPTIFDTMQPKKGNLIDAALYFALSEKNRLAFTTALMNQTGITVQDDYVALSCLVEQLNTRHDLTPFAQNRLALLNWLVCEHKLTETVGLSEDQSLTVYKLIYSLYKADIDTIHAVSLCSMSFDDVKEMHRAAKKIQFWVRETLPQDKLTSVNADIEPNNLDTRGNYSA
jgi:ankyrin repeat protein